MISEARAILDTDKIKRLTKRVRDVIEFEYGREDGHISPEFMCAASLAHHGLLVSMERLGLRNIDLSSVPAQHLSSLVSCVISYLSISNVSGCDLASLLTSIKCQVLTIRNQSLGREETKALLRAMESSVKKQSESREGGDQGPVTGHGVCCEGEVEPVQC